MRISDWSSDVCSSDLRDRQADARLGIEAEADKRTVLKGEEGRRDENLRALTGRRVSPAPFIGVIDDAAAVQHVAVFVVSEGRCIDGHRTIRVVIDRSEEHTSELQSLMRISYAVFCLKKKTENFIPTRIT